MNIKVETYARLARKCTVTTTIVQDQGLTTVSVETPLESWVRILFLHIQAR